MVVKTFTINRKWEIRVVEMVARAHYEERSPAINWQTFFFDFWFFYYNLRAAISKTNIIFVSSSWSIIHFLILRFVCIWQPPMRRGWEVENKEAELEFALVWHRYMLARTMYVYCMYRMYLPTRGEKRPMRRNTSCILHKLPRSSYEYIAMYRNAYFNTKWLHCYTYAAVRPRASILCRAILYLASLTNRTRVYRLDDVS